MSGLEADQTDPAEVLVSYPSEFPKTWQFIVVGLVFFWGGYFLTEEVLRNTVFTVSIATSQ